MSDEKFRKLQEAIRIRNQGKIDSINNPINPIDGLPYNTPKSETDYERIMRELKEKEDLARKE